MLIGAGLAPPALAQRPAVKSGRVELPRLDFSPTGGWRRKVDAVRAARHQFLRAGAIRSLNLSSPTGYGGTKVTGHLVMPVLPVAFVNVGQPYSSAQLQNVLFSPAPVGRAYSLKTFYEQLSNGNLTVDGLVFPWVSAPQTDTYYEDGCNGIGIDPAHPCAGGGRRLGELMVLALDAASHGSDSLSAWSAYDNDGPDGLPNSGDDDGVVDVVTFLHADIGGECGNAHIWSHRYVVAGVNGGSAYVTRTPWAGHPGQFLKVNDYIIQSARGGSTTCDATQIMPIGTVAHETGHLFGLPDLYDTDPSANATEGVGQWSLMGSGNYSKPLSPSRMDAWSLVELGWVTVDSLSTSGTARLDPVTSSDHVGYVGVPNSPEFFLLENRQALESDSAQMDSNLPAASATCQSLRKLPGLLIWHIDQSQVDAHGFSRDNAVNRGAVHGVELVQADGRGDLDVPGGCNRGDGGDAFPGSTANQRFSLRTNPAALTNGRVYAGFALDSIVQVAPAGQMAFRLNFRMPALIASAQAGAVIRVNGVAAASYADVLLPGDQLALGADSVQASGDGRSRFEFRGWSDHGDLAHTYTAGAAVDTVRASFAATYRVMVALSNALPDAVTLAAAPLGSDLQSGVFLPGGAPVTLTATAPAGTVFGGWSGDTTAHATTLTLPMAHPYTITATFISQVDVTVDAAANALLGTGTLTAAQAIYLDARGNHNGSYDLGDFLAFARASGVAPGSAATQRVMAGAIAAPAVQEKTR